MVSTCSLYQVSGARPAKVVPLVPVLSVRVTRLPVLAPLHPVAVTRLRPSCAMPAVFCKFHCTSADVVVASTSQSFGRVNVTASTRTGGGGGGGGVATLPVLNQIW